MRLSLLLTVCFVLGLLACGEETPSNEHRDSVKDTAKSEDSVANVDTVPATIIASQLGGDTITPGDRSLIFFTFSKTMLKNKNKSLSVKEVRQRFMPIDPDCDAEAAWTLERFFYLDSLKKIGETPDTDMGQTILVEIKEYDTIKNTTDHIWVAWTMFYETSQSCPYATGTYFMLSTYDKNGQLISTQCMGRDCGGADAPLQWVSVQQSNLFTDGSFRGLLADTSADDDFRVATDLSIMRKTFTGAISQAGKITTEVKEIERND